jgi:ribosomal protein S20
MAKVAIPKIVVQKYQSNMLKEGDILVARHLSILRPVLEFFKKDVKVFYEHGKLSSNGNYSSITVNMWSAKPKSELAFPDKDTAFGFKYCNDAVFIPNEKAVSYGDDIPLIQYLPDLNRIDFLYDVCEYKSEDEIALMKKLILGLLETVAGSKEAFIEAVKSFQEYEFGLKRKALVGTLTDNEKRNNENRRHRLENNTVRLGQIRAEVRNLIVSIETDTKLVNSASDIITELEKKIDSEFDIIKANQKVASISVDERGLLNIFTNTLYSNVMCNDNKTRRYLFGKFRINVNIGNGGVHFFNINRENTRRGLWTANDPHPHVNGADGTGCLGNCAPLIADCIDTYQWGALADILINYLESVNTSDSAGRKVYRWQEVDKDNNPIDNKTRYYNHSDDQKYNTPVMDGNGYVTEIEETFETYVDEWDDDEDHDDEDNDGYDEDDE